MHTTEVKERPILLSPEEVFKCACGWQGTIEDMNYHNDYGEGWATDQHECPNCRSVLKNNLQCNEPQGTNDNITMNTTETKERPILFGTEMVKAILEGRKTQTRRIAKLSTAGYEPINYEDGFAFSDSERHVRGEKFFCPYGKSSHRLWVRETWAHNPQYNPPYEFSTGQFLYRADGAIEATWKPSIHMPRYASRLLLEIEDIRVERLQNISEKDAIAEGIEIIHMAEPTVSVYRNYELKDKLGTTNPVKSYKTLWNSINGPDAWEANPWVWVVIFKSV